MHYIGIDIGGTKIKYGLFNEHLHPLQKDKTSTEAEKGGMHIFTQVCNIVEQYLTYKPVGIGISTAGIVKDGGIFYANDNIKGYTGLQLQNLLEEKYQIPVHVYNDVNAAALGEKYITGEENFFFMTLGTGVGGALVLNGKLWEGGFGVAGEIGYLPSFDGTPFDNAASAKALTEQAGMSAKDLFGLAMNGDKQAEETIRQWCKHVATVIFYIIGIINPQKIIIGGGISADGAYLKPILEEVLQTILPVPYRNAFTLQFAKTQNDAGMIGAVSGFLIHQAV